MHQTRAVAFVIAAAIIGTHPKLASAQGSASIEGVVQDASGALLPNAAIVVVDATRALEFQFMVRVLY